ILLDDVRWNLAQKLFKNFEKLLIFTFYAGSSPKNVCKSGCIVAATSKQLFLGKILLDNIRSNLAQNCSKNVEIFQFSRRLNFLLAGQMILCCKSGKDRTAMAVSCDQTEILFERGLAPSSFSRQKILDAVRTSGSRLENTLKNVGAKRYAFTHLQLSFMP
uniref:Uncharacterized protein n=1 Tax=Romanomermis culicivorax TaxID=13658 RepID=A0A915K590_ROMCU